MQNNSMKTKQQNMKKCKHKKLVTNAIKVLSIGVVLGTGLLLGGCGENPNAKFFATKNGVLVPKLETVESTLNGEEIARRVAPAIVGVKSSNNSTENIGAGVCVYNGSYILTNSHVVPSAKNIELIFSNGSRGEAIKLWEDTNLDVAVLKSDTAIPYLPLANVENVSVGEEVMAVGTPLNFNLNHTFTKGVVSAVNRTLTTSGSAGTIIMHNLIQHDASINPGNSGGPLINRFGEVIGINTLKMSGEGLGFAIPMNNLNVVLEKISTDLTFKSPNLGIACYDSKIENLKQNINLPEGVFVSEVDTMSDAYKRGITENCVITKINNTPIKNVLQLKTELYENYNRSVVVEYVKNGNIKRCVVAIFKKP